MENLELSQEFTGSHIITTTSSRQDILDVVIEQIECDYEEEIYDKFPDITDLESILVPFLTDEVCQEFMDKICILEANADDLSNPDGFVKLYEKLTKKLLKLANVKKLLKDNNLIK